MPIRKRARRDGSYIGHFEILPFTRTGNGKAVQRLRKCSQRFKRALAANDAENLAQVSRDAWEAMHDLTLSVRKAEDKGAISSGVMPSDTGWIADNPTPPEHQAMMVQKKVDRRHIGAERCSLRKCLNKLAHATGSTYRVDGRGAHYLVLTGPNQAASKGPWVCEFNVNTLAKHCELVLRTLS